MDEDLAINHQPDLVFVNEKNQAQNLYHKE
jgi:aspartate 1-decarboxylase